MGTHFCPRFVLFVPNECAQSLSTWRKSLTFLLVSLVVRATILCWSLPDPTTQNLFNLLSLHITSICVALIIVLRNLSLYLTTTFILIFFICFLCCWLPITSLSSYEFHCLTVIWLVILQSLSMVLESSYSILATIVTIWIYSLLYMFDDYRIRDF